MSVSHATKAIPAHLANSASARTDSMTPSILGRLTPQEWRRRALHMLPGLLPLFLWVKFHHDPLSWDCRGWMALILVSIGAATAIKYQQFARRGESSNPACILGYTIPIFVLLIAIPAKAELGLTLLAILAMGDGSATLGGLLLRGPKLPWNPSKTWSGFVSFVAVGGPYSAMIYWGEARPGVPFATALGIAMFATTISAICESLDTRINDNVRVGIAASLCLVAGQFVLVGW